MGIPDDACDWLLEVWDTISGLDDAADGDAVENPERMVYSALVGLQVNAFFVANASVLRPIVALAILKWRAANDAEKNERADAQSYMWRAAFYDLVLMVSLIVHGPDKAMNGAETVLRLYGEALDEYLAEFPYSR